MKRVRTLTLCLIAAFALTAIAATIASAEKLPAWGKCEVAEKHEGKYADAGCTEPTKKVFGKPAGGYEWYPLAETSKLPYGEDSKLNYTNSAFEEDGILQPVSEITIAFADGHKITCGALEPETKIILTGAHATTIAPYLRFRGCHDDSSGGECHTLDARSTGEITASVVAWENGKEKSFGKKYEEEEEETFGPSWNGTMTFIEGKRTSNPVVGMVYTTQEKEQPFLQQLVCEGSEDIHAAKVGGHKRGEELVMPIEPVNVMSPSFTARFSQSGGVGQPASLEGKAVKPVEALVNAERWETVGFETTMLFPTELYIGAANRDRQREELELKATP
jgi:hypothetical protein